MRLRDVPAGSTMTSYLSDRSPSKSRDDTTVWFSSYCSNNHIIQPAGMLFAARQSPTHVGAFRR